jgi:hypothetical protein
MAPIIAISQHVARGWSSLHPIFKEHRRKSFNYPEKILPDFSNLKANCGRWASSGSRRYFLFARLDAFSGLTFCVVSLTSSFKWVAVGHLPVRHFPAGSG